MEFPYVVGDASERLMTKTCSKCKTEKPVEEFYKNRTRRDGLTYMCQPCHLSVSQRSPGYMKEYYQRNKDKALEYGRVYREQNRDYIREYKKEHYDSSAKRESDLKKKYGMSLQDYEDMVSEQDSTCLICEEHVGKLLVDHCHESGEVRGLLCSPCNTGIGHLREDVKILEKAIEYLRRQ